MHLGSWRTLAEVLSDFLHAFLLCLRTESICTLQRILELSLTWRGRFKLRLRAAPPTLQICHDHYGN